MASEKDVTSGMNPIEKLPCKIRWAKVDDWKPAMMMVWKTFMKFESPDYSQKGIKEFFEFITDDDIYKAFLKGTYRMMVAVDGDRIIGVCSLRNINVISLLFVDEEYHRQGVGSALLDRFEKHVKEKEGEYFIKVNAAPYAVGFYEKLGFTATAAEQNKSGIRITPMEKVL